MGLDYCVKFKTKIKYNGRESEHFTPFSRGLSQFIGNHLNTAESLLIKVEETTGVNLKFITKPNLYLYQVDEMQLEFADEDEKIKLLEEQKEFDKESYKAWCVIDDFLNNLKTAISILEISEKLSKVEYDSKRWLNYLDNGNFINDLEDFSEILESAKAQDQQYFTFIIF